MAKKPKSERTDNCPACGLVRPLDDAHVYECPQCGKEAFDCCIAGTNVLCFECEEGGG